MQSLAPLDLLTVWEHAYGRGPLERAVVFAVAATPGSRPQDVLAWPVGWRDHRIAWLRRAQFGALVRSVADCPGCQHTVEFEVNLRQFFPESSAPPRSDSYGLPGVGPVTLRPVTTQDLLATLAADGGRSIRSLARRCLSMPSAEPGHPESAIEGESAPLHLTDDQLAAVSTRLEELDPQARIELKLDCPDCSQSWSSLFDISSIFWAELNVWARGTLREVHSLAARYGWSESTILQMSPWRRRIYLGLVGAGAG